MARPPNTRVPAVQRVLAGGAAAFALGGCGHDSPGRSQRVDPPVVPPIVEPVPTAAGHGHHYGDATIGGEAYPFEEIVTLDGAMRLHIGGPFEGLSSPSGAVQFIGTQAADKLSVEGTVVGEDCTAAAPGRFCSEPAYATLTFYGARGELRVATSAGEEIWTLETTWSDTSYTWGPADVAYLSGQLRATLAEFVVANDTILAIDDEGRLFFQSPGSGCVGNGALTAHDESRYSVYADDRELQFRPCTTGRRLRWSRRGLRLVAMGLLDDGPRHVAVVCGSRGATERRDDASCRMAALGRTLAAANRRLGALNGRAAAP